MAALKIRTVGALREALSHFPDDATPISVLPPFSGVQVVEQNDGSVLIAPCDDEASG